MKPWRTMVLTLAVFGLPAAAHEGHDHGEGKAQVAPGNQPLRLADGTLFLPKSAQRSMGVLTLKVAEESLPMTLELAGRVIMDPHLGGRVQAMIPGRAAASEERLAPIPASHPRKTQTRSPSGMRMPARPAATGSFFSMSTVILSTQSL